MFSSYVHSVKVNRKSGACGAPALLKEEVAATARSCWGLARQLNWLGKQQVKGVRQADLGYTSAVCCMLPTHFLHKTSVAVMDGACPPWPHIYLALLCQRGSLRRLILNSYFLAQQTKMPLLALAGKSEIYLESLIYYCNHVLSVVQAWQSTT